jgi:hypothetical protein
MGLEWLQAARSVVEACARSGGELVNRGGRRVAGDAARLTGGAELQRGPMSAARCGRERGKRGSAAVGHRQASPTNTVSGGVVQTRF